HETGGEKRQVVGVRLNRGKYFAGVRFPGPPPFDLNLGIHKRAVAWGRSAGRSKSGARKARDKFATFHCRPYNLSSRAKSDCYQSYPPRTRAVSTALSDGEGVCRPRQYVLHHT